MATTDRVIVADTYIKVGLKFIGGKSGQGRIEYYINGGLHAFYDLLSADNWPDVNHLAMGWFQMAGDASDTQRTMDWWKVAATEN